jgi:GlpG protein
MRQIGSLPTAEQARLFSDYLIARGIPNEAERDRDGTFALWIAEEDHLATGQELLARFQANPQAAEFRELASGAADIRAAETRANEAFQRKTFTRRRLFPAFGRHGVGPLTCALIAGCVLVALISRMGADREVVRHFFITDPLGTGEGWLPEVRAGAVWRLVIPVFLHFGPLHLIFNLMWLFQLGCLIEARRGTLALATLVTVIATASNLAQFAFAGPRFGGMSGVVYGLFGYVWIRGKHDRASGLFIDPQSVVIMVGWFFACLTGWLGPVANMAHGVGLALGMAWGAVTAWRANRRAR